MTTENALGAGIGIFVVAIYLAVVLGVLIFTGFIAWRITARTGHPGALGLLYFVPIANLVFLLILAFGEWPIQRELNTLKEILAKQRPPIPTPPVDV